MSAYQRLDDNSHSNKTHLYTNSTPKETTKPTEQLWKKNYQKKFKKLGSEIFSLGFVSKMKRSISNFFQSAQTKEQNIDKLAIGIYLGAEHLSHYVGGALDTRRCYAYRHACDLLASTTTAQHQLGKELHDAETYLNGINNGRTHYTSRKIHEKVNKLKVGKSIVVPSYSSRHAMLLRITCTEDSNGKKKYKCVLYNEGRGIDSYHYSKIDEHGKQIYQTAFEINDVSEENLTFDFFKQLCDCSITHGTTPDSVYNILKTLGGTIAPPSEDPRLWSSGQLSGSCSARCILSLIRSQSSPEEYEQFMQKAQYELVYKAVKQLRSGSGDLVTTRIVGIEALNQLESAHKSEQRELPEELKKIRESLSLRVTTTQEQEKVSENLMENMEDAFKNIEEWISTNVFNDRAMKHLTKAIEQLERLSNSNTLTIEESEKIIEFYKKVIKYFEGELIKYSELGGQEISREYRSVYSKLTQEQTYIMTVFASIMKKTLSSAIWNDPHKSYNDQIKIKSFLKNMLFRFKSLDCQRLQHMGFYDIIEQEKLPTTKKKDIVTPPNLMQWHGNPSG